MFMDPKALHRDNDVPAMYRSKKKKKKCTHLPFPPKQATTILLHYCLLMPSPRAEMPPACHLSCFEIDGII